MTAATPERHLLRLDADARLNGVACAVRIICEPQPDGSLSGVVGLPDHYREPLVGFDLGEDRLKFVDLPGDEAALARAFGVPGDELRGCVVRLATQMLLGPDVRQLTSAPDPDFLPAGATVH